MNGGLMRRSRPQYYLASEEVFRINGFFPNTLRQQALRRIAHEFTQPDRKFRSNWPKTRISIKHLFIDDCC